MKKSISSFEDLEVWQDNMRLAVIYLTIRLKWIPIEVGQKLVDTSKKISKQIATLIKVRKSFEKGKQGLKLAVKPLTFRL